VTLPRRSGIRRAIPDPDNRRASGRSRAHARAENCAHAARCSLPRAAKRQSDRAPVLRTSRRLSAAGHRREKNPAGCARARSARDKSQRATSDCTRGAQRERVAEELFYAGVARNVRALGARETSVRRALEAGRDDLLRNARSVCGARAAMKSRRLTEGREEGSIARLPGSLRSRLGLISPRWRELLWNSNSVGELPHRAWAEGMDGHGPR
jgi:hypothetical protein